MVTREKRDAARKAGMLNDGMSSPASGRMLRGKNVASRLVLPSDGVSVHFDHTGDAHYTVATEGFLPGYKK